MTSIFSTSQGFLLSAKRGIVNRLTDHYDEVVKDASCRLLTYALNGNADFMGDDIHYASNHDFVGIEFSIHGMLDGRVRVGMPGKFNADNALAAWRSALWRFPVEAGCLMIIQNRQSLDPS